MDRGEATRPPPHPVRLPPISLRRGSSLKKTNTLLSVLTEAEGRLYLALRYLGEREHLSPRFSRPYFPAKGQKTCRRFFKFLLASEKSKRVLSEAAWVLVRAPRLGKGNTCRDRIYIFIYSFFLI